MNMGFVQWSVSFLSPHFSPVPSSLHFVSLVVSSCYLGRTDGSFTLPTLIFSLLRNDNAATISFTHFTYYILTTFHHYQLLGQKQRVKKQDGALEFLFSLLKPFNRRCGLRLTWSSMAVHQTRTSSIFPFKHFPH